MPHRRPAVYRPHPVAGRTSRIVTVLQQNTTNKRPERPHPRFRECGSKILIPWRTCEGVGPRSPESAGRQIWDSTGSWSLAITKDHDRATSRTLGLSSRPLACKAAPGPTTVLTSEHDYSKDAERRGTKAVRSSGPSARSVARLLEVGGGEVGGRGGGGRFFRGAGFIWTSPRAADVDGETVACLPSRHTVPSIGRSPGASSGPCVAIGGCARAITRTACVQLRPR